MNKEDQLRDLIDSAPPHIQRHFACDCAERALRRVKMKDKRLWKAIEVSRRFAEGKATDEELDVARSAAGSAAEYAWNTWYAGAAAEYAWSPGSVRSAAEYAASSAWNAARSTARSTAWNAAEYAWYARYAWNVAWSPAEYVASATTREEEQKWQIEHLRSLIADYDRARSSLLYILQQRAEALRPTFTQYARTLEERVFE